MSEVEGIEVGTVTEKCLLHSPAAGYMSRLNFAVINLLPI